MTNQILQSDLDLAAKMMGSGHTDAEIVEALVQRRIEPGKVSQVVAALRSGQKVEPEVLVDYETGRGMAERRHGTQSSPESKHRAHKRRHSDSSKSGKGWLIWVLLGLAAAVVAGYFLLGSSTNPDQQKPGFEAPPAPEEIVAPGATTSPQSVPAERRSGVAQ